MLLALPRPDCDMTLASPETAGTEWTSTQRESGQAQASKSISREDKANATQSHSSTSS